MTACTQIVTAVPEPSTPLPTRHFHVVAGEVGYAASVADEVEQGSGGYVIANYAYALSAWFEPRAYAGMVLTYFDGLDGCEGYMPSCEVTAQIGIVGVKGRLIVPIPWVAPFVELGIGTSIGAMRTLTPQHAIELVGITYHVPIGLGLALGPNHNTTVALNLLLHPIEHQWENLIGVGFAFALP